MLKLNIKKLYHELQKIQEYTPPYKEDHLRFRQIMLMLENGNLDLSSVTVEELEELIEVYRIEDYDEISAIEADLEKVDAMITSLRHIPPRRVRNVFI
jgi:hypothetical protein